MSMLNTESAVSVSGFTGSFINQIYPNRTIASGATTVTAASGAALLGNVIFTQLSGDQPSFSGQALTVQDAVSGMTALASGRLIFDYRYGVQSGLVNGRAIPPPEHLQTVNIVCHSGLVLKSDLGYMLTAYWQKINP